MRQSGQNSRNLNLFESFVKMATTLKIKNQTQKKYNFRKKNKKKIRKMAKILEKKIKLPKTILIFLKKQLNLQKKFQNS